MSAEKPYILSTVKSGRNPRIPACRMLANEGRLSMNEILKLDNVEKYYSNKANLTKAVDKISFSVEKGEFVGIMGASGSGKTTLLNCISTIDRVTAGHIYVGDKDITTIRGNELNKFRREELGFIFQDFNLLDTLTGYENIALALSIQNVKPKEIDSRIQEVAKRLGIEEVLNKYSYQMSGGQKQRVAIARALVNNPRMIIADEPTGNLDPVRSLELMLLLEKINELGTTVLVVTHEKELVDAFSKRVISIDTGRVVSDGLDGYYGYEAE